MEITFKKNAHDLDFCDMSEWIDDVKYKLNALDIDFSRVEMRFHSDGEIVVSYEEKVK